MTDHTAADARSTAPALRAAIAAIVPELTALRRDLHAHPELGYAEHRTSATVRAWLDGLDVPYRAGLAGGTGVAAHLPAGTAEGNARPAVALRADMDALPIAEATGLDYASRSAGVMHACGHDGHTAILLGAAKILASLPDRPQPVTFLFQPAEEGGAGGKRMVEDGALAPGDGGTARVVYGLHGWPDVAVGHVATRVGALMAACSRFDIAVTGQGGHAAQPERTRDPVLAAAHVVTALQSVVGRNVAPGDAAVVTVASIHGGSAFNLVPDEVALTGTIRAFDDAVIGRLMERIDAIAPGVAAALGCSATVRWGDVYPATVNDPAATARLASIVRAALGPDRVDDAFPPTTTAEDFAYYGHEAPACFFFLGVRDPNAAAWPQLHQADYDFNDDAIAWGVELMVRLALEG
ncbi:MAG: amidohydrolase [Ardenticatenales bacterium]